MFGSKIVVKAAPTPSIPVSNVIQKPRPRLVAKSGDREEIQNYVVLCQKIGAETPAVKMLRLKNFLAERGIPEYDIKEVRAYLDKLLIPGQTVFWMPLRTVDDGEKCIWLTKNKMIYPHLVPSSVLETVSTILEVFPDAQFFVSYIATNPDPFLIVTYEGQTPVVVDFWDEPGFRPVKTS